jgi:TPR repeat protein
MTRIRFLLFLWFFLTVPFAPAAAGECRALLRPLMLQAELDDARLMEVRELCVAEADAGDADALYQSSLFYLGLLEWSPDDAIPMISAAAVRGVPEAQYWLAWQYDEGPLLPNNAELALRWYEAAGDGEHRLALERLATAYQNGELGVPPDARKAAVLRARAERCRNQERVSDADFRYAPPR